VLLDLLLIDWLKAGIADYLAYPVLLEQVFRDDAQLGTAPILEDGLVTDDTKVWVPGHFTGGLYRWGETDFPILGNTQTQLTVAGDPSLLTDPEGRGYQIIPPVVAELAKTLAKPLELATAYTRMPTQLPAITLRLERDMQGDTYWNEDQRWDILAGVEQVRNRMDMVGTYLFSLWSTNPLECVYLYAWLLNMIVRAQGQFTSWGLSHVSVAGSDVDALREFLPEQTYVRHLAFTAQRPERATNLILPEAITGLQIYPILEYQQIRASLRQP
jgi:hypothetical protein